MHPCLDLTWLCNFKITRKRSHERGGMACCCASAARIACVLSTLLLCGLQNLFAFVLLSLSLGAFRTSLSKKGERGEGMALPARIPVLASKASMRGESHEQQAAGMNFCIRSATSPPKRRSRLTAGHRDASQLNPSSWERRPQTDLT